MPKTPINSHSPGKEPKKGKCPPFEETVTFYIENNNDKERALVFGEWLRKNKLSPSAGNNGYNWYVKFYYANHNIIKDGKPHRSTYHGLYIKLFNDAWHILPSKDILEQIRMREDLKYVIENSVFPCYGCNYGCFKHIPITARGHCIRQPLCFTNPDDKTLDAIKQILLKRKNSEDLIIGKNMNIYNYGMK